MKEYTVNDIVPYLTVNDHIVGDLERRFNSLDDAESVQQNSLDWLNESCLDPEIYLKNTLAKTIIVSTALHDLVANLSLDKTVIFSDNPKLLFARIARALFVQRMDYAIESSAIIEQLAQIEDDVYIGHLTYIGKAIIKTGSIIMENCTIGDQVEIGHDVFIKSGARIGNQGFGFVRNAQDELEKFPQIGSVRIYDDVEIGANTCIDRGALSVTIIGRGSKIDNLCQIAHNVCIGENCFIAGNVSIAGRCKIGNNVHIGPSVTINQGLEIGDNAFISMGSVVTRNVKKGQRVIGYPAIDTERFVNERYRMSHLTNM